MNKSKRSNLSLLFISSFIFLAFNLTAKENQQPYISILGIAQDAGYPQAGCYQKHCMRGWQDPNEKLNPVSLGVIDPIGKKKYLFEATPSLPEQMYQLDQLTSDSNYKLDGVFLTHAHIGHYTGLMFLGHESMSAKDIPVYAMPRMKSFLEDNGPWSQLIKYKNIILQPLKHNNTEDLGSIKVTPFLVPHRDEYSETVGFKIEGPNKSALFIPDINKWSVWKQDLSEMIKTVDYAFLDSTFFAQGELPGRDMSKVPHPLVTETMDELKKLSKEERNKVWLIHFNHTNPLLNADSDARKQVKLFGFNIAEEGLILTL